MVIEHVLLRSFQPFDYVGQHSPPRRFDETGYDLMGYVLGRGSQHLFELRGAQSLDDHFLLLFFSPVILLESFLQDFFGSFPLLFLVKRFEQPFSSLLHLDQPRFKSLPELIVLLPPSVRSMPNIVHDEISNASFPGLPK